MGTRSLAALLAGLSGCAQDVQRPSVILVSIDTLRADHVGLYGYPRDTTPFLDRWSRGALVFDRAFTPRAWTLPAHMTMLSGLFPAQHGVLTDDLALSKDIPLIAERLRGGRGYQTVGLYFQTAGPYSSSYVGERYGFGRGFDVFRSHEDAEEAGAHLREELARLDRDRPFFLFLHLFDVHAGPLPEGQRVVYPSPPPYQDFFLENAGARVPDFDYERRRDVQLTDPEIEALTALYDGGIRYVDAKLEEWFTELEREGWLEDALVIVTADHGEDLGQRFRHLGQHGGFWNEGLHIPLIVHHPRGLRAGERVGELVHLGDIVPTILDVAGLANDPRLPGRSLFGELPDDRVLTGSKPPGGYVLQWPRKIVSTPSSCWGVDLARDPGELHPVPVPRAVFDQLRLRAFPIEQEFPPPIQLDIMSEGDRAELRALGYDGEDDQE